MTRIIIFQLQQNTEVHASTLIHYTVIVQHSQTIANEYTKYPKRLEATTSKSDSAVYPQKDHQLRKVNSALTAKGYRNMASKKLSTTGGPDACPEAQKGVCCEG